MAINQDMHGDMELNFLDTVGYNLSQFRMNSHKSQDEVIKELANRYEYRMSRQHLSQLECGRAGITLYEAVILCNVYQVSMTDILSGCGFHQTKDIPPYQKHKINDMTPAELRRLILGLENQLESIYDNFR